MIEYRHSKTEVGMNGSKERFSACSVGTSILFTIKFSGLLITCKLIYIKLSPPTTLFIVLMKEVAFWQFPWLGTYTEL